MKCVIEIKPYYKDESFFWSSTYGWTTLDNADLFSYEESMCLPPPIDGHWINIEDLEQ